MYVSKQKPKRRWQNLLYLKCPNCSEKLEEVGLYLTCPTPHDMEDSKNCFFIKKEKVAELLLDPQHPANYCLTHEERDKIQDMINKLNI